jgi:taurine dioxygenase
MTSKISHERIAPFGVEAKVDLARLAEEDEQELRRLYALEGLLVIRGLPLSADEQADFCRIFGPVPPNKHDIFLVSNVDKDGIFANLELLFHHDITFVPAPFLAGCLHALEVSEGVSATRFASGFRAYERLPQRLRDGIEGMKALFLRPRVEDRRVRLTDCWSGDNCAVHAIVQRQEGTGRPYLFLNSHHTACIAGLPESESDALIDELLSYIYTDDNIYDHNWTKGDLVLWDNLALQHARNKILGGIRTLRRVSVAHLGYDEQYPADSAWYRNLQEGRINSATQTAA